MGRAGMDDLIDLLLETGMLQFGAFHQEDGGVKPFRFLLEMLPAYPDVLKQVVHYSQVVMEKQDVQRLVAAPEAIPYGVALSLAADIPLIHSRGRGEEPAYDLVGAYDSGHRALVVCNALLETAAVTRVIQDARRVGLDVRGVLAVVGRDEAMTAIEARALLTLADIGRSVIAREKLPKKAAMHLF